MKRVEVTLATMLALAGPVRSASAQESVAQSPPSDWENVPPPPTPPPETSVGAGQWVYTDQYGWIWIPYGDEFTYVPPGGTGAPYEYVYYPSYGWTWVAAPWIWGYETWPYFGVYGAASFGWYGGGGWRTPWLWNYRPAPAPVPFRGTVAAGGFRAMPGRGFMPHGVPAVRGSVGRAPHAGMGGRVGGSGRGGGGGRGGHR
jgi:hypothetical protein